MILFTSDTDKSGKKIKTFIFYLPAAIGCAVFGAVYEMFSFGVYSYYMIGAFLIPLTGGGLLLLLDRLLPADQCTESGACGFYHAGIATLTVGSIIRGVLEIYGTMNSLSYAYWYAGAVLIIIALILYVSGPANRPAE